MKPAVDSSQLDDICFAFLFNLRLDDMEVELYSNIDTADVSSFGLGNFCEQTVSGNLSSLPAHSRLELLSFIAPYASPLQPTQCSESIFIHKDR